MNLITITVWCCPFVSQSLSCCPQGICSLVPQLRYGSSKMQTLTNWVTSTGPGHRHVDGLLDWQQQQCGALGLAWPPESAKRGKPSRQWRWHQEIYQLIRAGREIPAWVGKQPPEQWVPGVDIADYMKTEAEIVAVCKQAVARQDAVDQPEEVGPAEGEPEEAGPAGKEGEEVEGLGRKRRKHTRVGDDVKQWFWSYHDVKLAANPRMPLKDVWKSAQRLLPETLGNMHFNSIYKWKRTSTAPTDAERRGRKCKLQPGHITMLGELVERLSIRGVPRARATKKSNLVENPKFLQCASHKVPVQTLVP